MVRKLNPAYSPYSEQEQQSNMQYPPPGPPPQDAHYNAGNQAPQRDQWQGYTPQGPPPIGPGSYIYPPPQSGESQEYYRPPYQPDYQNQNRPYGPPEHPPYAQQGYPQPPYSQQNYQQQYQPPPPQAHPYPYASPPQSNAPYSPPPQSNSPYGGPTAELPSGPPPPLVSTQADEERGLMGALAGGTAGGYAGHKMHHGFLGAMGGAYAGHKLEDAYKDHQEAQKPVSPAPSPAQPAPEQQHTPSNKIGNFSISSSNVTLDDDYDLIAECTSCSGQKKLSSISLNAVITNNDGHFEWVSHSSGNFGASARNVSLINSGRVLQAELAACNGQWKWSQIDLDERIENNNGDLKML